MQLTRYTDFSFRTLIFLALHPGRLSTITEIAQTYSISRNHLVKVVHRLGAEGFIKTYRGNRGGIQLARDPAEIRLSDVVRRMEGNLQIVDCMAPPCRIEAACGLHGALREARESFLGTLDNFTIADLIHPRREHLITLVGPIISVQEQRGAA